MISYFLLSRNISNLWLPLEIIFLLCKQQWSPVDSLSYCFSMPNIGNYQPDNNCYHNVSLCVYLCMWKHELWLLQKYYEKSGLLPTVLHVWYQANLPVGFYLAPARQECWENKPKDIIPTFAIQRNWNSVLWGSHLISIPSGISYWKLWRSLLLLLHNVRCSTRESQNTQGYLILFDARYVICHFSNVLKAKQMAMNDISRRYQKSIVLLS